MVGLGGGFILVPILRHLPGVFAGRCGRHVARSDRRQQRERCVHVPAATARAPENRTADRRSAACPAASLGAMAFAAHLGASLRHASRGPADRRGDRYGVECRAAHGRPARARHRVHEIKGMSYRGALGLGFVVGIFSSLFGLGGGIVLGPDVPLLLRAAGPRDQRDVALCDPAHLAARPDRPRHAARHRRPRRRAARRRRIARRPDRRAALASPADRRSY